MNVSVIMCTYNGALYVQEQLNSILGQTYPIAEILVFDDASTDNTTQIVTEIAAKNGVIKLTVNEKNIGFNKNFEQALKAASGNVIAIADQDDIWVDTKIEKMLKAWKEECPVIYCDSILFSDTPPANPKSHAHFRRFEGTDARKIFLFNTISGHAMLVKKDFLPLVLPFTEGVMYDWWMAVTAAYNGGVQYYPEVLVLQRLHENNITAGSKKEQSVAEKSDAFKKFVIRNCHKFNTTPNMPSSHKEFLNRFHTLMQQSLVKKFHFPLFVFILKHRRLLFNYKKRRIGFFSYLKHSYLRTLSAKWKLNSKENLSNIV